MIDNIEPQSTQAELKLEDIIAILLKWKWVVLFFSLTIPILALLAMLTVQPTYTASTIVTLKSRTPESRTLGGRIVATQDILDDLNEELFIKSRVVMTDVVRELNLNIEFKKEERFIDIILALLKSRPTKQNYREAVSRVNLEGSTRGRVYIDFITARKFIVTTVTDGKKLGTGNIGEIFTSDDATFLIDKFPHKSQDRFMLAQRDITRVARGLAGSVEVSKLGKTRTILNLSMEISATDTSPKTAVMLANTIASVYMKLKLEESSETVSQVLRFIDEQMGELRVRTEESILDVEKYKERENLFFIEESARVKMQSMLSLDMESNTIDLQILILENLMETINQGDRITSKQIMLISSTPAPVAAQIAKQINGLQLERKAMERKYTPLHPEMLANEGKIEEARHMLMEALESHIEIIKKQSQTNKLAIERFGAELGILNDGLRNLKRLERVSFINEALLTYLMRRNEETKIQKASIIANVQILKPAMSAMLIKPQRERYIISGILAGILVGIGISIFLESMDNSVKSPSWVERELGLSVYGMIPHFMSDPTKDEAAYTYRDRKTQLITRQDPKSMVAESYRALRTNIQFADMDKKPKILLLTSPAPREGKSTTIANLAITIANMGTKTLIMDCDLRKPIIHRFFNLEKEIGITDVLTRNMSWGEAVKSTEVENCFVLTSGKSPPNPSELLGSKKMKILLDELKEEFDLILIDSSPIIPVTDSVVLSPEADAVFLVFELRRTSTVAARTAVNSLKAVHVIPTGVIINNIRPEDRRSYGYGYGYGYGYKYRYGYGYKYYRQYEYDSYYTTDDDDEKQLPKTFLQAMIDKIVGRRDDNVS